MVMSIGYDDAIRKLFERQTYQFTFVLSHKRLLGVTCRST
jgi:hypothetical protein